MPAQIIPPPPGIPVSKFAIVGKYAQGAGNRFVSHLALAREDGLVTLGSEIPAWHMQPPLVAGQRESRCTTHVAAWIALTADERDGITDWLAEVEKENRPTLPLGRQLFDQYTLSNNPKDQWHYDENSVPVYRRFSCVTFVLGAYRDGANIELLDLSDKEKVPQIDMETIVQTYEIVQNMRPLVRAKIGIPEDGPWCIPLPGYVCHAMNRAESAIRETPYTVPGVEASKFPMPA